MYKNGDILNAYIDEIDKIRLEDCPHFIRDEEEKYWMKGMFICEEMASSMVDGRACNGCGNRCAEIPLFVKIYEGDDQDVIEAMENQGSIRIPSPYIAKSYGTIKENGNVCTVMEYIDGKNVFDFCRESASIYNPKRKACLNDRERLVLKYRLMRQMLYAVSSYQKYRKENGIGIHLDLKPEHFLVTKGNNWNDYQIKLIDFEGFTNQNQNLRTFQMTAGYAHPEQLECVTQKTYAVQIRPSWDYYALGIVFYEMLEEEYFFNEDERRERTRNPQKDIKEISLKKHLNEMESQEYIQLKHMLEKMLSMEDSWDSVEEMICFMNTFINQWVRKEEIVLLHGTELMKKEELDLMYGPYVQVGFLLELPEQKPFYQYYEVPQNGIISLMPDANLPVYAEADDLQIMGYLYEQNGSVTMLLLEQEQEMSLQVGDSIKYKDCTLTVCGIHKVGYQQEKLPKKRSGRGGIRKI